MKNFNNKIFTVILILFLSVPVHASAFSIKELNVQVAELLARVFNLKAKLDNIINSNTNQTSTTTLPSSQEMPALSADLSCLRLGRNLSLGDRGADVTNLQLFLARNSYIYPEAEITGYFGLATQRAVQRYQVTYGIVSYGLPEVTGYGVVGPKTRAKMSSECVDEYTVDTSTTTSATTTDPEVGSVLLKPLSADPVIESLPLNSTVRFTLSDKCISYSLDWGDGTRPLEFDAKDIQCIGEPRDVIVNHVYPRSGVYTLKLRAGENPLSTQLDLALPIVSYKTIVAGSTLRPFSVSPTEGPAPLAVTAEFSVTHPACTSYMIDWGDGRKDKFEANTTVCSKNPITRKIKHIYDISGKKYEITFRKGQGKLADLPIIERWFVTVEDIEAGKSIVNVSETSGRPPLTVKVELNGTYGYCTSYEIDWGDGSYVQKKEWVAKEDSEFNVDDFVTDSGDFVDEEEVCSGSYKKTFTHTYVTYGAYPLRIKFGKGALKDIDTITHWVSVFAR